MHEKYMQRCLQLAMLARGDVAPNPLVGAVLVHEDGIIGEGYHRRYGGAHAEVNCLESVKPDRRHLIPQSTLYVSLEPCAHYGKTPPCADRVVRENIPRVVVGCRDPFAAVNGKGIEKLREAGINVTVGVLEDACRALNRPFFTYHEKHRPYVLLKWAQSANGFIARADYGAVRISNEYTNRLVHRWRSEAMAIAVGTNTALYDNPSLTTRHWPGANPVRVVVDKNLRLPATLQLFDSGVPTLVFNFQKHSLPIEKMLPQQLRESGVSYYQITPGESLVPQMLNGLYQLGMQSLLVEGGTQLLQAFLDEGYWDEARVISNGLCIINEGIPAPVLKNVQMHGEETIFSDTIRTFWPLHNSV